MEKSFAPCRSSWCSCSPQRVSLATAAGIFVIDDCCADLDPTLHACLLEKALPGRATVIASDEFVGALE